MKINVKNARSRFSSLLDMVEQGDEVIIIRNGKEVARMISPRTKKKRLPSLKDFRKSLHVTGKPLSAVVIEAREEERY